MQLNNSILPANEQKSMNPQKLNAGNQKSDKIINDKDKTLKDVGPKKEVKKEWASVKSDYLKLISKLENKVTSKTMGQEELDKIFSALEEKLVNFSPKQQMKLLDLKLFKKMELNSFENIGETLSKLIDKKETQTELFELLKSQDFISLLMNEPSTPGAYSSASVNQNISELAVV